ncbi:MAG TPA: AMP-binding protein [Pyrinomonadaceae bacterium]|nr:AMP-binding protein [Chloracidobacterium sp.]MBP9934859.1 AMP-binding protein [Pyrinomonadaceae bacterium]MBK7803284.1 AMP-binding protein [Chloracidobacterium sp.]HQX55467.1 AMP-binding protein [Pyrinomonadaceae bacterium]HQY66707.1 AMP-binding protein [Pyrinomonadaceae bacterium]
MNDQNLLEDQPIAWTPTPDVIERSRLTQFMRQVGVATWEELYAYSINDVERFTEEVLKFLDIKFDPPYEKLLDTTDGIEFPKWFTSPQRRGDAESEPGAIATEFLSGGLNITEMCLDRWQTDEMKDQPAVIWEGEEGEVETVSYSDLLGRSKSYARLLRASGIQKGDAVVIHLPMMVETVIALLAIGRIGAIAVPVFSGYGISAIESRVNAVKAKALFTCDAFPRRGKEFRTLEIARQVALGCPTLVKTFIIARWESELDLNCKTEVFVESDEAFDLIQENTNLGFVEPTSAEDPLIILYTSGTTGKPKGIAHTHASFPIKAAQDMAFGTDVGKGTRISWYTDIGWMMGPWLIYGALINGATICIYDGAPDYPTPDRMWEFCAKHKVEVLGISPTLVRSLASHEGRSEDAPVLMRAKPEKSERRGWSRHGKLPHFDGQVTQFITFRLADSLPQSVLNRLRQQLEHDKLDDDSEELRQLVEDYLDSGAGECILRDTKIAEIVRETLLYEQGKSCDLKAWIIMPNHVHLLLRLYEGDDLAGLMKGIKGISARRINQLRNTTGPIWQADYFDRYIRDGEHFSKAFAYIENNPVLAKLSKTAEEFRFGSAFERIASANTQISTKHEDVAASGDEDKIVLTPFERHDLSSLRIFASTGEPWNPAPWWWLFEKVGDSKLPIINYSGGTEISGGILMGNPLLPIKPCSFPAPCPGMDVDILDEDGKPVAAGQVGELVIKQPWIGMARGFWQEKERYLDTYWRRFKDIWVHGDFAMRDKDGHWFILGRSDDTLKVAGKRVGPAEVESILVSHPSVIEAAVIGVPDDDKGTAMVAFCVIGGQTSLITGENNDDEKQARILALQSELKTLVVRDMGKPLAPSKIHFVSAIPKTRNAKVMRRVIRSAYLGEDAGDLSALENPDSVEDIRRKNA